jgi:predicted amidophosphoribosyltransferase
LASALPQASCEGGVVRFTALTDPLSRGRDEFVAALVPPACAACRAPLEDTSTPLCVACRCALPWLHEPRCPRCALPAPCGPPCPAVAAAFDRAWAPLAYDGPARRLVAALKFRGALPLAELMAAQIAATAPVGLLAGATLVPVPLHPARRRVRGFDQAALLAAALGARTGLPVAHALQRSGAATRQLGARRGERLAAGRLSIVARGEPVPARALLVDDVHTTGATFHACARALRSAGSERVAAVAYARSLRR